VFWGGVVWGIEGGFQTSGRQKGKEMAHQLRRRSGKTKNNLLTDLGQIDSQHRGGKKALKKEA